MIPPDTDVATPPRERAGEAWWRKAWAITWRMTVFLLFWGVLLVPAVLPDTWLQDLERRSPALLRLYFDGTALLASLAACWLMVRGVDRKGAVPLGFGRANAGTDTLRGLAGGVVWLGSSLGLIALLGGVRFDPHGEYAWPALVLAAGSMLLNAAVQEVITRSYLFQMVRRRAGPAWALLVSSVYFTAIHAGAFHGAVLPMVNVFAASVLFGLVLLRTGNLWAVIALHFSWNFLVGPVLGLAVSGQDLAAGWRLFSLHGPAWLAGGAFGIEGSAVVTLVTIGACAVVGRPWRDRVRVGGV